MIVLWGGGEAKRFLLKKSVSIPFSRKRVEICDPVNCTLLPSVRD